MHLRLVVPTVAALACLASPAVADQLTAHIKVNPERLWQCGDGFFANGGSETYRYLDILADGQQLGRIDLANPADCAVVFEYRVTLPANGTAVITVKAGPYTMDSPLHAADRNRVFDVNVFLDSVSGQLVEDYAAPWPDTASEASAATPPDGSFSNTINIRVAPDRQWQCGDSFFTTGGSKTYEFATITVDGAYLTTYDFANPADCARIERVTRMLPDKGQVVVGVEVNGARMDAPVNTRDRNRSYWVNFFVDTATGELIGDDP